MDNNTRTACRKLIAECVPAFAGRAREDHIATSAVCAMHSFGLAQNTTDENGENGAAVTLDKDGASLSQLSWRIRDCRFLNS